METSIQFTRINNDVNGNPRYVCHFLNLLSDEETENTRITHNSVPELYAMAIKKAKTIGGRKYNTKSYGGGIVFQSYNIGDLEKRILELQKQPI